MKPETLKLLAENARYTDRQLAQMTGNDETAIREEIAQYERDGVIRGYKAVIDWEKLDGAYVSAIVALKVVPKADLGFEEVAERVASFPEVESVYLISGAYDLSVVVKGKTLQDVANFVAKELATLDSVTSTDTHFVMRRYKEMDVVLKNNEPDERENYLL